MLKCTVLYSTQYFNTLQKDKIHEKYWNIKSKQKVDISEFENPANRCGDALTKFLHLGKEVLFESVIGGKRDKNVELFASCCMHSEQT